MESKRLTSLDALRGFDMLLIAGGGLFVQQILKHSGWSWSKSIVVQMDHLPWGGLTFWDFIFPLFLFISGVSLTYSVNKALSLGMKKKEIFIKIFKRALILILLGIVYKNAPLNIWEPGNIRYGSVLGRIGVAVTFTTVLYLNYSWQKRLLWVGGILVAYYAALFLIPVPGYGAGDLSQEGNLVGWFDRNFMPGHLLFGYYDPSGLLTQFPALCITVLGTWAGDILRNSNFTEMTKIKLLVAIGIVASGLGLLWGLHFPINALLVSSSYVLLASGMSFLILSLFYWIIDIKGYEKWAFFFVVIGMNSLFIYLANHFIDFGNMSRLLFSGIYGIAPAKWHPALEAFGGLMLLWLLMYYLYKKKIFFKV